MQSRFHPSAIWAHLRSTYWFLPSLITVACVCAALALIALDRGRDADDYRNIPGWFIGGGTDGARALLSAVAGSMVTVVSVTFSVTIVALTVSSQHFGPRLLNNFMRDKGAQVVLGIFIGTFTYCLVVLRTVQSEGEYYERLVPHLAVTGAVALSLVSVAALIYYIHHVASSLQLAHIALAVSRDLDAAIARLYPQQLGMETVPADSVRAPPAGAVPVPFTASGYVQIVEADGLMRAARKAGLVVWLQVRPGDFATEGLPLALVDPRPADLDAVTTALNDALVLGPDRTGQQDTGFPLQQLVEVTLHALSTGINEPFTAVTCIDRMGQGLAKLATRRIPSPNRTDEAGQLRVIAIGDTFGDLLDSGFNPIRAHASGSPETGKRLMEVLARLAVVARRAEDQAAIRRQAVLTRASMERWLQDDSYGEHLERAYQAATRERPPAA